MKVVSQNQRVSDLSEIGCPGGLWEQRTEPHPRSSASLMGPLVMPRLKVLGARFENCDPETFLKRQEKRTFLSHIHTQTMCGVLAKLTGKMGSRPIEAREMDSMADALNRRSKLDTRGGSAGNLSGLHGKRGTWGLRDADHLLTVPLRHISRKRRRRTFYPFDSPHHPARSS